MGRPPSNGAPAFRFNQAEVAQMEAILREHEAQIPTKELLVNLAEKFSNAPERAGKVTVQMKQVWNWFQNRRYALRSKLVKSPGALNVLPLPREEVAHVRSVPPVPQQIQVPSGHNVVRSALETTQMEFEAKSARDGAWYDVQAFSSHRYLETGNPEVQVRFAGFGPEEDEWVNVCKHVRQRSLPCESSECVAVLPGDLILCFQEGKEQALYFDAHVLDAQRRRHDIRGCRCRFLVRYDHDQSEEIVPLRKVCRRPETDYRLQLLHAANESGSASASTSVSLEPLKPVPESSLRITNPNPSFSALNTTLPSMSAAGTDASASALASVPAPSAVPAPAPAPALGSTSTPVPVVPVQTSSPVSVSVAETNKAEEKNPGLSGNAAPEQKNPGLGGNAAPEEKNPGFSGNAAPENIINPGSAGTALESNNIGTINQDAALLAGNNLSLVHVSGNPVIVDDGSEKRDNPSGHPELTGSSATASNAAPLSSVIQPTENLKE